MEQKERTDKLSDREQQVLKMIAGGFKDDEISQVLGISTTYIRTNLINGMLKRSGTVNRPQLVYWAIQNGVI